MKRTNRLQKESLVCVASCVVDLLAVMLSSVDDSPSMLLLSDGTMLSGRTTPRVKRESCVCCFFASTALLLVAVDEARLAIVV